VLIDLRWLSLQFVGQPTQTSADLGAKGPPPADDDAVRTVLGRSLLSRAGLERREHSTDHKRRYDPTNNAAGQIEDPNKPL